MKLTARQIEAREILNGPAKHVLLDGGSRSGKTSLLVRNIALRALKAPGSRHAAMRYRFTHCKEAIGLDTFPKVMKSCFPDVPYQLNKSDWYALFPNQSELWFGGLDDKERVEKVLGKEFATILLSECSQIPLASRNIAVTRLAQKCPYEIEHEDGRKERKELVLKMYYDQNSPSKSHWSYKMFHQHVNPETRQPMRDPQNYASFKMNPTDNAENLPADYLKELDQLPGRLRTRFYLGEYGDAAAGALWSSETIDRYRADVGQLPQMLRIVVAVDPSGAGDDDNAGNDDIGIVVAGLGIDGNGYVLEDLTCKAGPKVWGNVAVTAYDRHRANVIVAEVNYGGAMVEYVVQTAKPHVPFKKITASRGKSVRAEPIAALTDAGKIRFAGQFLELEDELCSFTTKGYMGGNSPNRGDAMIWAMSELFPGIVQERQADKPLPIPKTGIV